MSLTVEFALKWVEDGSNSMQLYSSIMSEITDGKTLNIVSDTGILIATVVNITPMLEPIRIQANTFAATSILLKVVSDWQDPNKKIEANDIINLISSAGTLVATIVVIAEIAPEAAIAGIAIALAADVASTINSYLGYLKIFWNYLYKSLLSFEVPLATDTSSLYVIEGTNTTNSHSSLATYDEIMDLSNNLLFAKFSDGATYGAPNTLILAPSAIPGSVTPVDDASYLQHFCQNAGADKAQCMSNYN